MGRGWPRCCAISGLVTAVVGAVLALTFPLFYHAILNYVSIHLYTDMLFLGVADLTLCSVYQGIIASKGDVILQIMGRTSSLHVHQVLSL